MKINVNLSQSQYDIVIEESALDKTGELIQQVVTGRNAVIITDDNVDALYSKRVISSLEKYGFTVTKLVIKNGEHSKTMDTVMKIFDHFYKSKLKRNDVCIALGGGVIGDTAGFAASTYLRGINFVNIPTSLLSQVDSSIGGKTAVNLPTGKNQAGTFYQPKLVIVDPLTLNTLSNRVFNDGLAEVIKYGCICSANLFLQLESYNTIKDLQNDITSIISQCIDMKRIYVQKDELDTGERIALNFGHTFGHAIESFYNFLLYTHGESVAIGMNFITEMSEKRHYTKQNTQIRIEALLKKYDLPYEIDRAVLHDLIKQMQSDKKIENGKINTVLLSEIGKSFIQPFALEEIDKIFI